MSENRHQMPGQWTKDARPRAHTHKLYNITPLKSQRKVPHNVEGQWKQPNTNQQHIHRDRAWGACGAGRSSAFVIGL